MQIDTQVPWCDLLKPLCFACCVFLMSVLKCSWQRNVVPFWAQFFPPLDNMSILIPVPSHSDDGSLCCNLKLGHMVSLGLFILFYMSWGFMHLPSLLPPHLIRQYKSKSHGLTDTIRDVLIRFSAFFLFFLFMLNCITVYSGCSVGLVSGLLESLMSLWILLSLIYSRCGIGMGQVTLYWRDCR